MPIIDFTGSYRDATRGATIKALQERQKTYAQAAMEAAAPQQISSPWQGGAQLMGVLGAKLNEGRAQEQEMAGRKRFAELLAGGLGPDELGEAITLDPENAKYVQTHQWDTEQRETERQQAVADKMQAHGWDVDKATAAVDADKAAAAEAAKVAAAQQEDQQKATADLSTQQAGQQSELEKQKAAEVQPGSVPDIQARAKAGQYGDVNDPKVQELINADIRKAQYIAPTNVASTYTPGEAKEETDFATDKSNWESTGYPAYLSTKANINKALDIFDQGKGSGWGPGILNTIISTLPEAAQPAGDLAKKFFTPDAKIAADSMKTAVQENLKTVLGSQFAAIEGSQMMERAFDPLQDPAENARRARIIMARSEAIANLMQDRIKYYNERGHTIRGWTGSDELKKQIADLASLDFGSGSGGGAGAGAGAGAGGGGGGGPDLSTMSEEDLKKIAGGQ